MGFALRLAKVEKPAYTKADAEYSPYLRDCQKINVSTSWQ
jgi:hypothetical protein